MKVRELIEKLNALPMELDVITSGYENGYDDVATVGTCKAHRDVNWNGKDKNEWWNGRHDDVEYGDEGEQDVDDFVFIG